MDWDWSKFDAPPGSGRSESSSGDEVIKTAAPGDVGVIEPTADTVLGVVAASTAAEVIASRTQVFNVGEPDADGYRS